MGLAGQSRTRAEIAAEPRSRRLPATAIGSRTHSQSDDSGFILVALLVAIAIGAVWMSAALPAWRQQATREREAELVFRGEQYARAIWLYRQKMNGALPSNFDDLVSQHTLRHKWKDPITDDEFLPKVACMGVGPTVPGVGVGQPGTQPPGGGQRGTQPSGGGQRGIQPPSVGQSGAQPPGGGFGGQTGGGGICGVQSKSKDASIMTYNGQQEYDLWQFDVTTASIQFQKTVARLAGGTGGSGVGMFPVNQPGVRGTGGRPGGPNGPGIGPPGAGGGIQPPVNFPGPAGPGRGPTSGGPTFPGRGRD